MLPAPPAALSHHPALDLAALEGMGIGEGLLGLLPDAGVMVVDADLRIALACGGALTRHGIDPAGIAGRTVPEAVSAGSWRRLEPHYRAALAGEPQAFQHEAVDASLWQVAISPLRGPDDHAVAGVLVVSVLVGDGEPAGADAPLLLREAFEHAPMAIGLADLGEGRLGRMLRVNPAAERFLGRPREELERMNVTDVSAPDAVADLAERLRGMARTGRGVHGVEHRYVRGDGVVVHGRVSTAVVGDADGGRLAIFHIEDVSAAHAREQMLAASEARFASVFSDAPVGMAIVGVRPGEEGVLVDVNPALCSFLGRPFAALVGRPYTEFAAPEDVGDIRDNLGRFLAGGGVSGAVRRYPHPDGRDRFGVIQATLVRDADGTPLHAVGMITDVTEQIEGQRARDAMLDAAHDAIIATDGEDRIRGFNAAAERMLGLRREDVLGRPAAAVVVPSENRARYRKLMGLARATEPGAYVCRRLRDEAQHADGARVPVEVTIRRTAGHPVEITAFLRDLTDERSAERRQRRAEEMFRSVFQESAVPMVVATVENRWIEANPALGSFLGRTPAELVALGAEGVSVPGDERLLAGEFDRLMRGDAEHVAVEKRYLHGDGHVVWGLASASLLRDERGAPRGVQTQILDITERKRAHEMLRALLASVAEGVYAVDDEGLIVFVNPAAERLLGWSEADLLGRSAHDVLHAHVDEADCRVLRVRRTGVAEGSDADDFVRRDGSTFPVEFKAAPLPAGSGAAGVVVAFSDITERRAHEAELQRQAGGLDVIRRVREAMEEDRLVLFAQPIVDLATGAPVQDELLIRMRDRDGTVVPPGDFLPVAEQSGLIVEIDRWVIGEGARLAAGGRHVEVNISAATLGHHDLGDWVEQAIAESGADPQLLTFEITETALADDIEQAQRFAERIADLGCHFALDDFGTGYGTFTYLKRLPIAYLKIDIEFVRDLLRQERDRHVVRAVVNLAHAFGLRTIAEGVEDSETLDLLAEMGVDLAQGFHLGRPAPLEEEGR